MRSVELRNSSVPGPGVRYDRATGRCSNGAIQLLTRERFDQLRKGWSSSRKGASCTDARKVETPATTGYPSHLAAVRAAGSAHVLVLLDSDGSVASAHAVCATDPAFADAAVATAMAIRYSPSVCDGEPVRSRFLLPFDYDWK